MPRKPRALEPERYPNTYPTGPHTWCYKLRLPADPLTGKRPWESPGGFPTSRAAWEARERRRIELESQRAPITRQTVRELVDAYLRSIAITIDGSSQHTYGNRARLYIYPYLGDVLVRDLEPRHIRQWVTTLATEGKQRPDGTRTGYATQTIRDAKSLLSAALHQAVEDRRIPYNPASRSIRLRDTAEKKPKAWTDDELDRFLPIALADEYAAYWLLGLTGQLRPGELAALTWADVDFDTNTVRVVNTRAENAEGRLIIGDGAKTPDSQRSHVVPAACIAELRAHRDRQQFQRGRWRELWTESDLVFTGQRGKMLAHETMNGRLRRLCTLAGVTRLTPHGLRHSGATWMRRLGESAETVSRRLGHKRVAFTLDNYSHTSPDDQRRAAERLQADWERREKDGSVS